MKLILNLVMFFSAILFGGCSTNDFKVVDALRVGFTKEEAKATIAAYGFERAQILKRPSSGWTSDGTFTNLPARAHAIEERSKQKIATAEYYPVGHGLLGAGQLFLFYGEDGRLMNFYRRQIN